MRGFLALHFISPTQTRCFGVLLGREQQTSLAVIIARSAARWEAKNYR
jgi:hypothetical protein